MEMIGFAFGFAGIIEITAWNSATKNAIISSKSSAITGGGIRQTGGPRNGCISWCAGSWVLAVEIHHFTDILVWKMGLIARLGIPEGCINTCKLHVLVEIWRWNFMKIQRVGNRGHHEKRRNPKTRRMPSCKQQAMCLESVLCASFLCCVRRKKRRRKQWRIYPPLSQTRCCFMFILQSDRKFLARATLWWSGYLCFQCTIKKSDARKKRHFSVFSPPFLVAKVVTKSETHSFDTQLLWALAVGAFSSNYSRPGGTWW